MRTPDGGDAMYELWSEAWAWLLKFDRAAGGAVLSC